MQANQVKNQIDKKIDWRAVVGGSLIVMAVYLICLLFHCVYLSVSVDVANVQFNLLKHSLSQTRFTKDNDFGFGLHDYDGHIYYRAPYYSDQFVESLSLAEFLITKTEIINAFVYFDSQFSEETYPSLESIYQRMTINVTEKEKQEALKHVRSNTIELGFLPMCKDNQSTKSRYQKIECLEYAEYGYTKYNASIFINYYYYDLLDRMKIGEPTTKALQFFMAWTIIHETYHYKQGVQGKKTAETAQYFNQFEEARHVYAIYYDALERNIKVATMEDENGEFDTILSDKYIFEIFNNYYQNKSFLISSLYSIMGDKIENGKYMKLDTLSLSHKTFNYFDWCIKRGNENNPCEILYVGKKRFQPCEFRKTHAVNALNDLCPDQFISDVLKPWQFRFICKHIFNQAIQMFQDSVTAYQRCQNITINGTNHVFVYLDSNDPEWYFG